MSDPSDLGHAALSVDGRATPSGLTATADWLARVVHAGREAAAVLAAGDSDIASDVAGAWPGMPYVHHRVDVAESCMLAAATGLRAHAEDVKRWRSGGLTRAAMQPQCFPQAVLVRTAIELSAIAYWALPADPTERRARGLTLALRGVQERRRLGQEAEEDDMLLLAGLAHKLALEFVDDQGEKASDLMRAFGVGRPMPSNRRIVEELIGDGCGVLTYGWLSAESSHASLPYAPYIYDDDDAILGMGLRWRDVHTCLRGYQAMRIRLCERLGADERLAEQAFYWVPWHLSHAEVVPDGERARMPAKNLLA